MHTNSSHAPLDRRAASSDSFYMAIAAVHEQPAARRTKPVRRCFADALEQPADRKRWSEVLERNIGKFRIYAGAVAAPEGGYTAAVEIHRLRDGADTAEIIFSSDRISDDYRFEAAASALRHALDIGHEAIRLRESLRS